MKYPKIINSSGQTLAILNNIISPSIYEKLNGEYYFKFDTIIEDLKTDFVHYSNFIEIGGQIFQISRYIKERTNENKLLIALFCEHISYQLLKEKLSTGFIYGSTYENILTELFTNTNFQAGTVKSGNGTLNCGTKETNKKSVLMQIPGQLGGELQYRGYTIDLLEQRGQDRGVQFRVGKNLRGIRKTVDSTNKDELGNPTMTITYEIDVLELDSLETFKGLEYFELGDTVEIIDSGLGISLKVRIVEYEYNPIRKQNSKVVLGNYIENTITRAVKNEKRLVDVEFKVTDDSIISTVTGSTEWGEQSTKIQQNVDSILLKANQTELDALGNTVSEAEASINVNANNIESKVSKDGVVSSINQSAEAVKINADKVDITGAVTFNSLDSALKDDIFYPGTTEIDGGNIRTESIAADKIKTEEIYIGKSHVTGQTWDSDINTAQSTAYNAQNTANSALSTANTAIQEGEAKNGVKITSANGIEVFENSNGTGSRTGQWDYTGLSLYATDGVTKTFYREAATGDAIMKGKIRSTSGGEFSFKDGGIAYNNQDIGRAGSGVYDGQILDPYDTTTQSVDVGFRPRVVIVNPTRDDYQKGQLYVTRDFKFLFNDTGGGGNQLNLIHLTETGFVVAGDWNQRYADWGSEYQYIAWA